jgi:hypothetical protein
MPEPIITGVLTIMLFRGCWPSVATAGGRLSSQDRPQEF